ncbi:MFS transporter [Paraburkholderia hayleyella]|uniref:MFS transporter n=1 Tax=Paraburkholderia hayleyella TaxID=2152889 RepID=UPI0012916EC4|nr:MFS transporter [Paraburkholderia hayleyella]
MKSVNSQKNLSWLGLAVLLTGGFVTIFDMFVVNLAIPAIRDDLQASFAQIGFVIAGYQLTFGMLLIAGGRLGDRYGRRKLYTLGMLAFTAASALCSFAPGAFFLILARALQGAAAALLLPQVYASIRIHFDEHGRRWAFGLLGMTFGVAAISGQIIGGTIVGNDLMGLGWRVIFLVNIPIGVAVVIFCKTIKESSVPHTIGLDWAGTVMASAGLGLILVPLMEGASLGWPVWTYVSLLAAIILLLAFIRYERYLSEKGGFPVIDMALFREHLFSGGTLVIFLVYSTSSSFFLCMALLLQTGFGLNPITAGLIFIPANVAFTLASLAAPKLVNRFGNGTIAAGALLYAASFAALIGQVTFMRGSALSLFVLTPMLFVFGIGQALSMTPVINLVLSLTPDRTAGMAAGLISTMQQVGGAFGVAIVGILFVDILNLSGVGEMQNSERYAKAFTGAMVYNFCAATVAACVIFWIDRMQKKRMAASLPKAA